MTISKNRLHKLMKLSHIRLKVSDYSQFAQMIEEIVLRQERFIERLSWRSHLSPKCIRSLIQKSTTIMTFTTLTGFDLGDLRGAAIGAIVGVIIVIGYVTYRVFFIRIREGFDVVIVEA